MTDELRINATDLARLIGERDDYEHAHREVVEKAQKAAREWQDALDEAHQNYAGLHRAVQEACGIDQARLLPEGELLHRVSEITARPRPLINVTPLNRPPGTVTVPGDLDGPELPAAWTDDAGPGEVIGHGAQWPAGGPDGTVLTEYPAVTPASLAEQAWVKSTSPDESPFTLLMQPGTRVQWISEGQQHRGTVVSHDAPGDTYVPETIAMVHTDNGQETSVLVRRLRPDNGNDNGPDTQAMPAVTDDDPDAEGPQ